MTQKNKKPCGEAFLERGVIVIRLPVKNLPLVLQATPGVGDGQPWYTVTDAEAFSKDLLHELNREDEIGCTRVHRMFDAAILEAIEQGAEGIEDAPMEWA